MRTFGRIVLFAVLTTLAGGQAASAGEVVVDFLAAEARNDGEDVVSIFGDPQDFFPLITVAGVPGPGHDVKSNRDFAEWSAHQVRATVDPSLRFYNVTVRLDEADVVGDETFDIHPATARLGYSFTFDACTMTYVDSALAPFLTFVPKATTWLPFGNGEAGPGDPNKDARVKIRISTGDGKPFTVNDLAITDFTPVQAPYDPAQIIENKPTAFKVRIESTFPATVTANVSVSLDDGIAPRTQMRSFNVPPEGLTAFLFEDDPYLPQKNLSNRAMTYSVHMTVPAEMFAPNDCESRNNEALGKWLPVVRTRDKLTVYRPFDAPPPGQPADLITTAELSTLYNNSEPFRKAIYPIASLDSAIDSIPVVSYGGFPMNNIGIQLMSMSLMAAAVGIDKMVLVPRQGSLADIGLNNPGVSLGKAAPRAVFVEHDTFTTASHELAHTFNLSRRNCDNGGALEVFFGMGCMDEYQHTSPPRPYIAKGFDVEGGIHPSGFGGVPGSREVSAFNVMDQRVEPFGRWVDSYTFDLLAEEYRLQSDPTLIGLSGWVETPGGLQDPPVPFSGVLRFSYTFAGFPDLPEAPLGGSSGAGRFEIRIVSQSGVRTYRFNPGYATDETSDGTERGYFALALPYPEGEYLLGIELRGPSDLADPAGPADTLLAFRARTPQAPVVSSLRAARDFPPTFGGPQPEPPTIGPGHSVVVGWQAGDGDSSEFRSGLVIKPPVLASEYNEFVPMDIELVGNTYKIPHEWLASRPGLYRGAVGVSDGVNMGSLEQADLFRICNFTNTGVEICDGLDNDCDGTTDDVLPPVGRAEVQVKPTAVFWSAMPEAERYDVVRGNLDQLRSSGGNFMVATTGCLGNDVPSTSVPFPDTPPAGGGLWVLVRPVNCAGPGTYDSGAPGQSGLRDTEIAASPSACP